MWSDMIGVSGCKNCSSGKWSDMPGVSGCKEVPCNGEKAEAHLGEHMQELLAWHVV